METLSLTTPQSVTGYTVRGLHLLWTEAIIRVELNDGFGKVLNFIYSGAPATSLMVSLNKANLTTQSLHSRILSQLVTDGKLPAGAVTGTPD